MGGAVSCRTPGWGSIMVASVLTSLLVHGERAVMFSNDGGVGNIRESSVGVGPTEKKKFMSKSYIMILWV